jgi:hypothetical protein
VRRLTTPGLLRFARNDDRGSTPNAICSNAGKLADALGRLCDSYELSSLRRDRYVQAADRYKAEMAKRKAIGDAEVAPTP